VDRLPPAELLDRVLAESAYVMELSGAGLAQARENLKKIRGLVRRIQNRGYATLERLVEHFSQLVAGGDESNAIIDATDAVNLMTVHAAKGLEYPVVFIVNLGRGSGGGRDPIRVVVGDGGDEGGPEPMVGIGEHETDADADADARDAEESKRLLYVALTRARDRVYLAGVTDDSGRLVAAKGSLARYLPESLLLAFGAAAPPAEVTWTGPAATHVLRSIPPPADAPVRWWDAPAQAQLVDQDFGALGADGVPRTVVAAAATDWLAGSSRSTDAASNSALGTLVHALLARAHRLAVTGRAALRSMAERLAHVEFDGEVDPAMLDRAVSMVEALLAHPDMSAAPGASTIFEAPYSRRLSDGRIERGTVDAIIVDTSSVRVLEIKTGAARTAHSAQLGAYVEAVREAYPTRTVEGRVIYVAGAS
jgi:ATP-dependent helicase/nuclease subunit A